MLPLMICQIRAKCQFFFNTDIVSKFALINDIECLPVNGSEIEKNKKKDGWTV